MKLADVRRNAFAMPLTDPAYPPGPYKFYNREFVVITYRTDPDRLREVVPEPLGSGGRHGCLRIHPHARIRQALATTPRQVR
jgi:Acetoacetate decarboxylase (ADC)